MALIKKNIKLYSKHTLKVTILIKDPGFEPIQDNIDML